MSVLAKSMHLNKIVTRFAYLKWYWQWLLMSALSLLIYFPVLGNSFVNDDFTVLKKVCLDKQLNVEGFFRPLNDISIYANYLLAGLDPLTFYLTSVLLHALNAVLLFRFCNNWRYSTKNDRQNLLAFIATLLFLTYPFHNESVVWVLGRGSLIAATCAFIALTILGGRWSETAKLTGVSLFYFIGIAAYESIFVLPAIVLVLLLIQRSGPKRIWIWMSLLGVVFLLHLLVRVIVSGSVAGEYGSGFFLRSVSEIAVSAAKVIGRLFIPPVKDPVAFTVLVVLLSFLLLLLISQFRRKIFKDNITRSYASGLIAGLIISLSLPAIAAVSTNTSESDRFLYFPSFFLCILEALVLIRVVSSVRLQYILFAGLLAYNVFFLQMNNRNWQQASKSVTDLMQIISNYNEAGKLFIVNLPDEINGAFIFRVGFEDALLVNCFDTSKVKVVNQVKSRDLKSLPVIQQERRKGGNFIAPATFVQKSISNSSSRTPDGHDINVVSVFEADRVVYWNKYHWVVMNNNFTEN